MEKRKERGRRVSTKSHGVWTKSYQSKDPERTKIKAHGTSGSSNDVIPRPGIYRDFSPSKHPSSEPSDLSDIIRSTMRLSLSGASQKGNGERPTLCRSSHTVVKIGTQLWMMTGCCNVEEPAPEGNLVSELCFCRRHHGLGGFTTHLLSQMSAGKKSQIKCQSVRGLF